MVMSARTSSRAGYEARGVRCRAKLPHPWLFGTKPYSIVLSSRVKRQVKLDLLNISLDNISHDLPLSYSLCSWFNSPPNLAHTSSLHLAHHEEYVE